MDNQIEILLVEDTPSDIRLTQEALKRSDLKYELAVVNDGEECMAYLNKLKEAAGKKLPDIILLDLNMPRKNGHEVLAEIKEDPALRKIPVVLLTVSQRDEDVMEALKLKMNFYLAKPVTSAKLSVLIKAINDLEFQGAHEGAHSDEEIHVRLVLAGNPHTSPMVLSKLSDDPSERVRSRVAENPEVPPNVLMKLAGDPSAEVRSSVCENSKAPLQVLEKLAQDSSDDVRLQLAGNSRVPSSILQKLTEDDNIYVSSEAQKTLSEVSRK